MILFENTLREYRRKCCGITLVELLVVIAIIALLLQLLLPAVRDARETSRKISCINNMRQLGIAINGHMGLHGTTPAQQFNTEPGKGGKGMFNSLVFLLPFLEYQEIYDRIDFNYHAPYATGPEEVNHSNGRHAEIAGTQISVFLCPMDSPGNKAWDDHGIIAGNNSYVGNVGLPYNSTGVHGETNASETQFALPNGFLSVQLLRTNKDMSDDYFVGEWRDVKVGPKDFSDGLSKTVAYSERLINKDYLPDTGVDAFPAPDLRKVLIQFGSKEVLSQQEHYDICNGIKILGAPRVITSVSRYIGGTWLSGGSETGNAYQHLMTPNTRSCSPYYGAWWVGNIANTPSSYHPGGVNLVMADGSSHFISDDIEREVWWAMGSRNLGEVFQMP